MYLLCDFEGIIKMYFLNIDAILINFWCHNYVFLKFWWCHNYVFLKFWWCHHIEVLKFWWWSTIIMSFLNFDGFFKFWWCHWYVFFKCYDVIITILKFLMISPLWYFQILLNLDMMQFSNFDDVIMWYWNSLTCNVN